MAEPTTIDIAAGLRALEVLSVVGAQPEERFDRVTRLTTRLFSVPMAAVALVTPDRWVAKSHQGLAEADIVRSQSFCDITLRQPGMLVVEDTTEDERFRNNTMVVHDPYVRFYAGQPLEAPGGDRIGTLCILDRAPRTLTDTDRALLADLGRWVQKELAIDDELERAAEVQRGLLPHAAPELPGYDVAGACLPSRQVGGDLFDWYAVPGGQAFTLADVMGKGMPAAIVMAALRAVLRAGTRELGVDGAVQLAASTLESDFGGTVFATLFHAQLAAGAGTIRYVDAGHGLARVVRAGGAVEVPGARGVPLGAVEGSTWTAHTIELAPGDGLVVVSDGVLDLYSDRARMEEDVVAAMRGAPSAAAVVDRITAPAAHGHRTDDVTVVVLRRST
jgi:hypothetical protein